MEDKKKYTDARYPEKVNDLIDNNGNVNPETASAAGFATEEYVNEAIAEAIGNALEASY